jgi:hypothetical protein
LVLRIYLLSSDGEGVGWIRFLHDDSVEDEANNYGVNNFLDITIWRVIFPNYDIKVEMMSPP